MEKKRKSSSDSTSEDDDSCGFEIKKENKINKKKKIKVSPFELYKKQLDEEKNKKNKLNKIIKSKRFKTNKKGEITQQNPFNSSLIGLKENTLLFDYQKICLDWMKEREENFIYQMKGGIIADEPGLGKTIESLAYIFEKIKNKRNKGPFLVIVPLPLIKNWLKQINRHFIKGTFKICVIYSNKINKKIRDSIFYDIYLTTYNTISSIFKKIRKQRIKEFKEEVESRICLPENEKKLKELEKLRPLENLDSTHILGIEYDSIFIDEGHVIRDINAIKTNALLSIKSNYKWILTGTPMQNSLEEIYSLFNWLGFIHPEIKPNTLATFSSYISKNKNILKEWLSKIMIRRLKRDIITKENNKIKINKIIRKEKFRTQEELDIYNSINKNDNENKKHVFKTIIYSRESCINPSLIKKGEKSRITSTKFLMILEYIKELLEKNEKEKIIIFSQFTSAFDLFEIELKKKNIRFEFLYGKEQDIEIRERRIDKFCNDLSINVFLISLKIGANGINLVNLKGEIVSNNLILMDYWYNPAIMGQAIDRLFRIGQTKEVNVFIPIIEGTIEEEVIKIANKKDKLILDIIN